MQESDALLRFLITRQGVVSVGVGLVDVVTLVLLLELHVELQLSDRPSSYIQRTPIWPQRLQLGFTWSHFRLVSRHLLQAAISLACPIANV